MPILPLLRYAKEHKSPELFEEIKQLILDGDIETFEQIDSYNG